MFGAAWKIPSRNAAGDTGSLGLRTASAAGQAAGTVSRWIRDAWSRTAALTFRGKLLIAGAAFALVLFAAIFRWLSAEIPLSEALNPLPDPALTLVSADGTEFALRGGYKEDPVAIDEVPAHLIDALLAMEDRRYYYHFGIDPLGIARAAWHNFQAGEIVEGGSTITQQLAKITFLSHRKTFKRKIQDILLALWIETRLSKDEILVRYLSSAYFGSGVYGLRAAARFYFDKPVSALTLAESAMLVGILRSPSRLAPTHDINAARERAELVLTAMIDDGRLTAEKAERAAPAQLAETSRLIRAGSYFADWVAGELPDLEGRYGDVRVVTTLDTKLQKSAERIIAGVLAAEDEKRGVSQAALVAMRPDGSIVAMVGGRNYGESQFNRATQALRQPGSAFKLFVYLAALRDGASLRSAIPDRPIEVDGWRPRNFNGRYRGRVSLRRAFATSINSSAVFLSETAGRDAVIRAARDLGISTELTDTPSLALGASEVSLLELTAAYAAVAAERYPVKPSGVTSIAGVPARSGYPQQPLAESEQLQSLMRAVVRRGTGRRARIGVPAFGKTGTSQEYRDALFVGFAGNLVVGVWVGNDDFAPMNGVTGGSVPASIWREFMEAALDTEAVVVENIEPEPRPRRRSGGGLRRFMRNFGLRF